MLASEGVGRAAGRAVERSRARARGAGGGHGVGAARRLRRGAAARDARSWPARRAPTALIYVITDLQAAGWEDVAPAPLAAGPRSVVLDVSGGEPWEQPRGDRAAAPSPRPRRGRRGSRSSRRSRTSPPSRRTRWASRCASTAPRWRAGFVDMPGRAAARASASSTPCRAAARARRRWRSTTTASRSTTAAPAASRRRAACACCWSTAIRARCAPKTRRSSWRRRCAPAAPASRSPPCCPTTSATATGRLRRRVHGQRRQADRRRSAAALTRYVEAGGGLFISVGDRVDVDAWNQTMKAVLPQPLGLKRSAAALPGAHPEGETVDLRPAERLAPIDRRHPLLAAFPAKGEGLASARFFQFMLLGPMPDAPGRRIVLRYESGAPALVDAEIGRGRVLLLTTTVDREWTDLPIRPGFLPLVQEAARYLAGAPSGEATAAIIVGGKREIALGADDRRVEVVKPGGESRWLTPGGARGRAARAAHRAVRRDRRAGPVPRARRARRRHRRASAPTRRSSVTLDASESDPARLADDKRPDARSGAAPRRAPPPRRRLELWHALGAAAIVLVLFESLLTLRFRQTEGSKTLNKPFGNDDPKLSDYVAASTRPRTRCWPRSARAAPPRDCPTSRSRRSTRCHLEVLARAAGARRAVEIGTLGGYSGIALLRGMGAGRRARHHRAGPAARRGRARELPARRRRGARPRSRRRGGRRPAAARAARARSTWCSSTPTRRATRPTSTGRPTTCAPAASCCSTTPSCSAASPTRPPATAPRRSARCSPCTRRSPAAAVPSATVLPTGEGLAFGVRIYAGARSRERVGARACPILCSPRAGHQTRGFGARPG